MTPLLSFLLDLSLTIQILLQASLSNLSNSAFVQQSTKSTTQKYQTMADIGASISINIPDDASPALQQEVLLSLRAARANNTTQRWVSIASIILSALTFVVAL